MRKKFLFFLMMILVGGMVFVQIAGATTPFISTDGDSDIMSITAPGVNGLSDGWYFGVYSYDGSMGDGLDLLEGNSLPFSFQQAQFIIKKDLSGYLLAVSKGVDAGKSLDLGLNPYFSFYFFDGSNYYSPATILPSNGDSYVFQMTDGSGTIMNIVGSDLQAVPLPGTLMLLGSSIMSLLIVRRKRVF